jgi:hypothetical protein
MIEKFFKSTRKVTPSVLTLPLPQQHGTKWTAQGSLTEEQRATQRGLSVEEFRRRVGLVARAQLNLKTYIHDTVWPVQPADALEHGKCIVRGICRHYDDYGDAQWNENPFILAVSPLNNPTHVINCTANWVTRVAPEIVQGEC